MMIERITEHFSAYMVVPYVIDSLTGPLPKFYLFSQSRPFESNIASRHLDLYLLFYRKTSIGVERFRSRLTGSRAELRSVLKSGVNKTPEAQARSRTLFGSFLDMTKSSSKRRKILHTMSQKMIEGTQSYTVICVSMYKLLRGKREDGRSSRMADYLGRTTRIPNNENMNAEPGKRNHNYIHKHCTAGSRLNGC